MHPLFLAPLLLYLCWIVTPLWRDYKVASKEPGDREVIAVFRNIVTGIAIFGFTIRLIYVLGGFN